MSILLWITIEMEYGMKCLKFILFFTNGRQKLTAKGLISTLEIKKKKIMLAGLSSNTNIYLSCGQLGVVMFLLHNNEV